MIARYAQTTHALLRLVAGFLFLCHGAQKLFGWFGASGGTAELFSLMGLAGILEFYGGLAILVGLFTRPIALLLSGEMAVAYFTSHQPRATLPIQNHGELAALFAFVFLFFAAHGAGALSLDARFHKPSRWARLAGVVGRLRHAPGAGRAA